MSEHLEKAKAAIAEARVTDDEDRVTITRLLDIALVQATVAQAESAARTAEALERISGYLWGRIVGTKDPWEQPEAL